MSAGPIPTPAVHGARLRLCRIVHILTPEAGDRGPKLPVRVHYELGLQDPYVIGGLP